MSINNYDEIMTYMDFWLSKKDRARRVFHGIDDSDALKLRVDSKGAVGDAEKTAVAKTFANRFPTSVVFELLNDIGPYHQASLRDKLEIKLIFNDKKAIILGSTPTLAAAADADYNYSIRDICQITSPSLAMSMKSIYLKLVLPFTRIFEHQRPTPW